MHEVDHTHDGKSVYNVRGNLLVSVKEYENLWKESRELKKELQELKNKILSKNNG